MQPRSQNVNLILSVTAKVAPDWTLDIKGSYFDTEITQHTNPPVVSFGSFAGYVTGGPNQAPKNGVNAIAAFNVPATYPGNPFGVAANVRALVPDGARSTNVESQASRLVGELKGSAWGWDITGAAGYTNVRNLIDWRGYVYIPNLYKALNDPVNPYLLTGGNSKALQNFVAGDTKTTNWNNLSFIQASASRDLMQLQGGPLSLAIGAGDVYRNLNSPNPGANQDGLVGTPGGATYAVGSQNNANVYAEVSAPVLKGLEIDAAVRYDYYNAPSNSTWNPKVGVKWTPIQQIALRGTAGTGFRAPFITESGNAGATFNVNTIRDPLNCPVLNANGTPNLTSPLNVPTQCALTPPYLQSSNKDLKPEKSDSYSVGAIIEPIKGWSSTFDYYYIKLKNQIVPVLQVPGFDALGNAVRDAPQTVTFGDGRVGLSPNGTIAYINAPFVNAQATTTSGFDIGTSYTWTLPDNSKFLTSAQWTHILSYDLTAGGVKSKLAGTHGPTIIGGDTGTPRDRAQATLQWTKGQFTTTATVNYVGRFNVLDPSAGTNTCPDALEANNGIRWPNGAPTDLCNVASFTYVNLNFQYQLNKQWLLQASIQNAFNAKAPRDWETYGGINASQPNAGNQGTLLNPSMHQAGAVGPFWSLGFIYTLN